MQARLFVLRSTSAIGLALASAGCLGEAGDFQSAATAQSCMTCHNGSQHDDYAGPGLENPHPFPGADMLLCTTCHGGNPDGNDVATSHVPPPPQIGDREFQAGFDAENRFAYFNKLTLTGLDKLPDYQVGGTTYTALEFLQFVNPGDLRVTSLGQGCGQCHSSHADYVSASPLATAMGMFGGATYAIGAENHVPANAGLYLDTAGDTAFRTVVDTDFGLTTPATGEVGQLIEFPVYSAFGLTGAGQMFDNNDYLAAALDDDRNADNSVVADSPLSHLFHEQIATTCGDCHLGSAGANNRAGDFRSSGCTACHMPYSLGGRSGSLDPNVPKDEPLDPDDIDEPERAHVAAHRILSTRKTLPGGQQQQGIPDRTCAGCHQGSNRTVMQYWGIRLDQNQDVRNDFQYPADPVDWEGTHADTKLFDPDVGNHTFNGRNGFQYLAYEDYDGDGRDDTPADVHFEAGMGCIDCHGSVDLHGGDVSDVGGSTLKSRMEHGVAATCTACHGTIAAPAPTVAGTAFDGTPSDLAFDGSGVPLAHVRREADGNYYLYGKLDGVKHFLPQLVDVVADTGKLHPFESTPVYSPKASYAMGRIDADPANGKGPVQTGGNTAGFSHTDDMDCAACHSSWTNTCMGCHLIGEYDTNNNNFSNITGVRNVFDERNADFVYQSPVFFSLGVNSRGKIAQVSANTKVFFSYRDRFGDFSQVFTFSDRNGGGSNPAAAFPSMSHNALMAHSIRGEVSASNEGPRYCSACHLTDNSIAGAKLAEYEQFRADMTAGDWGALPWAALTEQIGRNPGNQLDSAYFVHMAAGLGSGLFLFDDQGAAVNPIDDNPNRVGTLAPPATTFDPLRVALNLDRIVEPDGTPNGSSNHALIDQSAPSPLRDGAPDPLMAGPLGATLLQRLTDPTSGIVLDSWLDADGDLLGDALLHVGTP
jgi:hypothetical protein